MHFIYLFICYLFPEFRKDLGLRQCYLSFTYLFFASHPTSHIQYQCKQLVEKKYIYNNGGVKRKSDKEGRRKRGCIRLPPIFKKFFFFFLKSWYIHLIFLSLILDFFSFFFFFFFFNSYIILYYIYIYIYNI
jgi:hypothetical protein